MKEQTVKLVDGSHNVLAIASIAEGDEGYCGTIDLGPMPNAMRAVFTEFEQIVNNQMFSLLDEIEAKIDSIPIKAVFENAFEVPIRDLQIYPSTSAVSFKVAKASARAV
jgi:hypothetical protein